MKKWFTVRLKKPKPWWWRLLHPIQTRSVNRWLRVVEVALQQEVEQPSFKKEIEKMRVDAACYGTAFIRWKWGKDENEFYGSSPAMDALKDITEMNKVEKMHREIVQTFIEVVDRTHKGIMDRDPEELTGLEVFPTTVTWDHLPKPIWRDIKLREDEKS